MNIEVMVIMLHQMKLMVALHKMKRPMIMHKMKMVVRNLKIKTEKTDECQISADESKNLVLGLMLLKMPSAVLGPGFVGVLLHI